MCCPSFKVLYTFIQNSSYHNQIYWIEKRIFTSKFSKYLVPWNIKSCRFFFHKLFNVFFQIWDCLFIDFDSLLARMIKVWYLYKSHDTIIMYTTLIATKNYGDGQIQWTHGNGYFKGDNTSKLISLKLKFWKHKFKLVKVSSTKFN